MAESYGKIIRETRKRYGLTQAQFASSVGISVMSLRRYEKNERQPTVKIIDKMASVLGLSTSNFLRGIRGVFTFDRDPNLSESTKDVMLRLEFALEEAENASKTILDGNKQKINQATLWLSKWREFNEKLEEYNIEFADFGKILNLYFDALKEQGADDDKK